MRIIAGKLKGSAFDSPQSRLTHPMSDRVRGALFNTLGDISGLTVFDPFGGSGALAFEAVSRGAKFVQICELDKQAQKTIAKNIQSLDLPQISFHHGNARSWLKRNRAQMFDVTLADPPYDDIDRLLLQDIADRTKPDGIFGLSWPGKEEPLQYVGMDLIKRHSYGDAQLIFYRRSQ